MKLKNINLGLGLMALLALSSCADDKFSEYRTDMTKNLKEYQYLNNYEPLKKYVEDMKAAGKCNPDFKLGIALEAAEFNKQALVYCLAGSNFNEMTAGNAMKMASCVKDDGSMDFSLVKEFVKNAKDAGLTIYGHTLAWHSQQPNKYLNGLIADKEIEVDPGAKVEKTDYELDCSTLSSYDWEELPASVKTDWNKDGAVVITNPEPIDPYYKLQYWLVNGISLKTGTTYKITFLCKAEGESPANIRFKLGNWGAGAENTFEIPVGGDYKEVSFDVTPVMDSNGLFFQHGDFAGKIYWKSVKITHFEAPSVEIPVSVGHLTFDDGQNLGGWGMDNTPKIVNGVCEVGNNAAKADPWNSQVNYEPGFAFENGKTYHLKMKIKGSVAGEFGAGFQNPDGYQGCGDFPTIKVTTDWKEVDVATTCNGDNALRLLLNIGKYVGTLYIDDFEVYYTKSANSIPLPPEEKKSLLTDAMGKWIDGMMEATDGYVTSWEVVNEALSGKDYDGDGKFDLQSVKNVSADDAKNNFYWQDYLGDIDYVRTAVAAARKSFAAHNGDLEKLKLFINDYNLESDWDDNGKLKSLIQWIKDWEADGVTKIDGIASQMHISCYADHDKQENAKNHIVKMLELMKESEKLCKISELDMGYVDAAGNKLTYDQVTEEQHKEMRDLYTFVLQKYFEIIPIDKQYGITQWCATDSPKDSGWRPGEPTGLWDLNYLRKHTYAGFAAGLGAPEYWNDAK